MKKEDVRRFVGRTVDMGLVAGPMIVFGGAELVGVRGSFNVGMDLAVVAAGMIMIRRKDWDSLPILWPAMMGCAGKLMGSEAVFHVGAALTAIMAADIVTRRFVDAVDRI